MSKQIMKLTSALVLLLSVSLTSATTASPGTETDFEGFVFSREMPLARSDMSATPHVVDGVSRTHIYLIGGCSAHQLCGGEYCYCPEVTNKTQYYDTALDQYYTGLADAPRPRYRHAAAEADGVIYLFGGRDLYDNIITEVDAYDISSNTWTTPCTWGDATSDETAVAELVNGSTQVIVFGGYEPDYTASDKTILFDPQMCLFTPKQQMPYARGDVQSLAVETAEGPLAFVIGGFDSADWCQAQATVASYNLALDTWTIHTPLILGRADLAIGEINGHLFAIGGETINEHCNGSVPVSDVERLDRNVGNGPYGGDWTVELEIPEDRFRYTGVSYRNTIFVFGGQGGYVEDVDGTGIPGYPVLNTTMQYVAPRWQNNNLNVRFGNGDDDDDDNAVTYAIIGVAGGATVLLFAAFVMWYQKTGSVSPRSHVDGLNPNPVYTSSSEV